MKCSDTCQHKITFVLTFTQNDLTLVEIYTVVLHFGLEMSDVSCCYFMPCLLQRPMKTAEFSVSGPYVMYCCPCSRTELSALLSGPQPTIQDRHYAWTGLDADTELV